MEILFLVYSSLICHIDCVVMQNFGWQNLSCTITSPAISSSNVNEEGSGLINGKMSFNPDITKQAQQIFFSQKKTDTSYPGLYFNNARIQ